MDSVGILHDLKEFTNWEGEHENEVWVQMYPYGSWTHPLYSDTTVDRGIADRMVQNFHDNTIGKDLIVDYDHGKDPAKGGKAAGKIVEVEARDDGLYGKVAFNDIAKQEIDNGEWHYWSTSHYDTWTNPQTQEEHEYVLDGGALTNRPYVKGMLPINFSEVYADNADAYDLDDNTLEWLKEHAVIAGAERDSLPDSAFLYVEPGGKKDAEGKTVPRSKRHLIFKNSSGKVDMNHVRNAKARLSQSGTGTSGGESWLSDSLRSRLLSRVNSMLPDGDKDDKKENSDVELFETLRDELKLHSDATPEQLLDAIKQMNEEVAPLREFKAEHQSAKKFADEYPAEAARMAELEAEAKDNRSKNFAKSFTDMRFSRITGTRDKDDGTKEPVKEATTLGLSALALDKVEGMAKKFADGNATIDDFKEFMDTLESGVVDYGTKGSGRVEELDVPVTKEPATPQEARKAFSDLIDAELAREGNEKMTYEEGYAKIIVENPEAYELYRKFKPVAA